MKNKQMEMGLEAAKAQCPRRPFRSHLRRARAQWWFDQMRQAVDSAFDWKTPRAQRTTSGGSQ
jgi:hypothetical protein